MADGRSTWPAGAFTFGPPDVVPAKGKATGIECRRLIEARTLTRPRGGTGMPRGFVGRREELAALRSAQRRTITRGAPELITLSGEAGVGKSRLVREMGLWLSRTSPDARRLTGRCPPFGQAGAYRPIADILSERFELRDGAPPEQIRARLGGHEILAVAFGLERIAHPAKAGAAPRTIRRVARTARCRT